MSRTVFLWIMVCVLALGSMANASTIVWVNQAYDTDGNGEQDDKPFVDLLVDQGYTVVEEQGNWTTLDAAKIARLEAADLIIISRSTASDQYAGDATEVAQWNGITTPLILTTAYIVRNSRWLWFNSTTVNNLTGPAIEVVEAGSPVFSGVAIENGSVNIVDGTTGTGQTSFIGTTDGNGTIIAKTGANSANVTWDAGTEFYAGSGQIAAGPRMFFACGTQESGATPQGGFNLTEQGKKIFLNAVVYMLGGDLKQASSPSPAVDAEDVERDSVLSWTPGISAATHNVYFSMNLDDVNNATVPTASGLDVNSFDPGRLEFGQDYYWRVDEVNGTPDKAVTKGNVWKFTAEPYSILVPGSDIVVSASSFSNVYSMPENTVNGSGLGDNNTHAMTNETMWFSATGDADPWIQFDFDEIKKLDMMKVWNSNSSAESAIGWGVKGVEVLYSVDGENWDVLADATQFSRAPGHPSYNQYDEFSFGGVTAQYVRFNILSNWGGFLKSYSLSEVQFYMLPVKVRTPSPESGSVNVLPSTVAKWRAGREAGQHVLYFDTDANAVADGLASSVSSTTNSLDLTSLNLLLGETYYWRVDEVNDAETPSLWTGPVWNLSTPKVLIVDDFERYTNDSPNKIFQTWIDGYGYTTPEPGKPGNGTGAALGHDNWTPSSPYYGLDFMETSIVKGGKQSTPFYYDNSVYGVSQIDRTWTTPQNWGGNGIQTLVLFFHGVRDNTGGTLYAKINGKKVVCPVSAGLLLNMWTQWNIDLKTLGTNLNSVSSLSIGVEGSGSGLVYIDDILLYRDAPAMVTAVDPGTAGLAAKYSMENNVNDTSGKGLNGTAIGTPLYVSGLAGNGQALAFDGIDDVVQLPIGSVIETSENLTIALWANFAAADGAWQRLFDFGTDTTSYMFLTPRANTAGAVQFSIERPELANEFQLLAGQTLPTGWQHVAVVLDGSTMTAKLYINGLVVDEGEMPLLSTELGNTANNYLGDSQWTSDAFYTGDMDEVCIFSRALSDGEIRYMAGDR